MNTSVRADYCRSSWFLLAPILAVSASAFSQTNEFETSKYDSGIRYLTVSSKTPRGVKEAEVELTRTQSDRLFFIEDLKRPNTAIVATDRNVRVEDIAARWKSQLGDDFTVSVLPGHYSQLITPRNTLPVGNQQADRVRMLRAAFPKSQMRAISLPTSDTVANYLLRADASATGDLPIQSPQIGPRPSMEIPVDGITYRVRAESLSGEGQVIRGTVRDPSEKIVGYATISLSKKRPGLKFSIGQSDFEAIQLGDTSATPTLGDIGGAAVLVEKSSGELPDHVGGGPSVAEPAIGADVDVTDTTSETGDSPPAPPTPYTVRLVVGYTSKAKEFMQPMLRSVTDQIIDAVKSANDAFHKHAIPVQFQIERAGIIAVPYVEHTATDATCCNLAPIMLDKAALRERKGDLAALESLRLSMKADVVILIESVQPTAAGNYSCGESGAIAATSPSDAIAVVNAACMDSMVSHSLTHELGHLLGARHDKMSVPPEGPPPPNHHAYGFVSNLVSATSPTIWRDVMSLPTSCNWCTRLPQFSDPRCLAKSPTGNCYPSGTPNENAVALMSLQAKVLSTVFERAQVPVIP